jgi:hypothetical protein
MAGLPEYYQQYSSRFMVAFDVLVLIPISVVLYVVLDRVPSRQRMQVALWIAFYFTVPLAIYDYIYCGQVLGYGLRFVIEFWYLSVYYLIPWLLVPSVAWLINQRARMGSRESPH